MEYRAQNLRGASFIILLVFEDVNGDLRFLVHPKWRALVETEDVKLVGDLFVDFLERAEEEPRELFKQLSSLGVGALVTQQTGVRISDYPHLLESFSQFVQL